jgi:hypothetical protein
MHMLTRFADAITLGIVTGLTLGAIAASMAWLWLLVAG